MTDLSFKDFESAGKAVLGLLHKRYGFNLWMLTRTEGDNWIILQAEDHGYNVKPGTTLSWAESFCIEMVKGNGPRIAPDSNLVAAYAATVIRRKMPINAYIGIPLTNADGSLFGTLCAIDPESQPVALVEEQELIEMLAALLSTILDAELKAAEGARLVERLELESQTDALTHLLNRRAWDQLLAREEERCRRYGHPAAVMSIDLDELKQVNDSEGHAAGDALIVRAAEALRAAAREIDIVARLGGDEFGIIAIECDQTRADALLARTRIALAERNVKASIGITIRNSSDGLQGAMKEADRLMYEEKRKH
jgi:diguanylate cyclase (GGDEF)-like protein